MKLSAFIKSAWKRIFVVPRRFPLSVLFLFVFTIFLLCNIDHVFEDYAVVWSWVLMGGACLTLLFHQWGELLERRKTRIVMWSLGSAVHLGLSIWLLSVQDQLRIEHSFVIGAGYLLYAVAYFVLPFLKSKSDEHLYSYFHRNMKAAGIGVLFWLTLVVGVGAILFAISELFLIRGGDLPENLLTIATTFVFPIVTMAYIPSLKEVIASEVESSEDPRHKLFYFVFLPLFGIYLLIIYLFIIKLIMNGGSASIDEVIIVFFAVIAFSLVELGLYPSFKSENPSFSKKLFKIIPILMIAPLILMSRGIIGVLEDADIVISGSLFLILFNLWGYGLVVGCLLQKTNRIQWIPISLSVSFFILAVLQGLIFSALLHYKSNTLRSFVSQNYAEELPMDKSQYCAWRNSLSEAQGVEFDEMIRFLNLHKFSDQYKEFLGVDAYWISCFPNTDKALESERMDVYKDMRSDFKSVQIWNNNKLLMLDSTKPYESVYIISRNTYRCSLDVKTGDLSFTIENPELLKPHRFHITRGVLEKFMHYDSAPSMSTMFMVSGEVESSNTQHIDLYITRLSFELNGMEEPDQQTLFLEGLLFFRKP